MTLYPLKGDQKKWSGLFNKQPLKHPFTKMCQDSGGVLDGVSLPSGSAVLLSARARLRPTGSRKKPSWRQRGRCSGRPAPPAGRRRQRSGKIYIRKHRKRLFIILFKMKDRCLSLLLYVSQKRFCGLFLHDRIKSKAAASLSDRTASCDAER